MFRTLLAKLTGATYEVRVISPTTGKDIPGRCLYKGTFFKARKAYLKAAKKLKYGQTLRLQAVSVLFHEINLIPPYEPITEADVPHGAWTDTEKEEYKQHIALNPPPTTQEEFVTTHIEGEFPKIEDPYDHTCNADGPMDHDPGSNSYVPTCSVCGKMN